MAVAVLIVVATQDDAKALSSAVAQADPEALVRVSPEGPVELLSVLIQAFEELEPIS